LTPDVLIEFRVALRFFKKDQFARTDNKTISNYYIFAHYDWGGKRSEFVSPFDMGRQTAIFVMTFLIFC